ncbi:50S ribosomal protein L5 [Candidatus Woesearchaeota archaeon]|nr:50S ribosomal protein L5 [Candidatus Woesearchaeota archaeon]
MGNENKMREIRIEKLTLNIGSGKDAEKLEKAIRLLKSIAGQNPVKTTAKKRIPNWGLRPGLPIGCKLTIRKSRAKEIIARLLRANDNKLSESQFDGNGNVSFGINEYIDIPGVNYDPGIGVMGLEASITLERRGYRVKRRRLLKRKIAKSHCVTKDDAIGFMKNEFGAKIGEAE